MPATSTMALGKMFAGLAGLFKDDPTSGDVHVDAPLGNDGKPKRRPKLPEDGSPVQIASKVCKVDESLGLVFGWAIVCKVNGEDYYDLNIDPNGERVPEHIPEDTMVRAATEFMQSDDRVGNEMHRGPDVGTYVFAFPLTTDIAKAMGIESEYTGLMIAYKPTPDILAKFRDGTYKGFSIEGRRVKNEEIV